MKSLSPYEEFMIERFRKECRGNVNIAKLAVSWTTLAYGFFLGCALDSDSAQKMTTAAADRGLL